MLYKTSFFRVNNVVIFSFSHISTIANIAYIIYEMDIDKIADI